MNIFKDQQGNLDLLYVTHDYVSLCISPANGNTFGTYDTSIITDTELLFTVRGICWRHNWYWHHYVETL